MIKNMPPVYSQFNETDTLECVIIGRWDGYRKAEEYTEIVNEDQKKAFRMNISSGLNSNLFVRYLKAGVFMYLYLTMSASLFTTS
jgi:hypothetical protein